MAESSGFFNAELVNGQYDREYLAEAFAKYFSLFIANGVFPNPSDGLQVFENTTADMNVLMHPGYAWIDGYWYKLDGNLTLAIDPADGVLNRIDSIVVRWDLEKRSIYAQVVKGTPASEPTAPEVMRSPDFSDLCVAHIRVDAGTTKIMQSMITDTRMNSSLCGIVTGVVQSIDTTTLFEQYQAALKEFQDTRMVEFDEWQEQEKSDFDNWFETIKGTLDGDTAGNLLNLITQETADRKAADAAIESKIGINGTATYEESTVKITAPEGLVVVTFLAPSDCKAGDKYTVNGDALTLTDLNGEPVEDAWKQGAPVTLTLNGNKAFFKAGGGGKLPSDLAPLCPGFKVERNGGKVKISADKIQLNSYTNMVSGGVWAWGKTRPTKPTGENTKLWSIAELITTGKPYDGLYLGDVTPSDAVTETLIYLPEKDGGSVKLVPFIILSVDYLGGVYVTRQKGNKDWVGKYGNNVTYENNTADTWLTSYLNSVLDKSIADKVLECEIHVFEQGTIKRKCWIPSYGELYSDFTDSGNTFMPYFNSNGRRALIKQDDGNLLSYWTRTFYNLSNVRMINPDGSGYFQSASNKTAAYRPSFVLPKDFKIQQRPDGSYTVWNEQGLMTLGDLEASTMASNFTLADKTEGETVKIKENGTPVEFYVAKHNYESELNGKGRTLMVRKDCYDSCAWDSGGINEYDTSEIDTVLNGDYKSALNSKIQELIGQTKFYYTIGNGNDTISTLARSVFVLSLNELGLSAYSTNSEGTILPVSDTLKIAYQDGDKADQWTRTPRLQNNTNSHYVNVSGSSTVSSCSNRFPYRPCFTLPSTVVLSEEGDVVDKPTPTEQPLEVEIDWPESDPLFARQWVYNEKGVYQTMLLGGIASTEDAPAFALPEFTGNHAIFGDEAAGRIELYESGTLTLSPGTYDFFLVGGGGSGTRRTDTSVAGQTGGGGGGYTFTQNAVEILIKTDFTVSVGAGGYLAAGSASTMVSADASINYTAAGGGFISSDSLSSWTRGANGGSGGGGGGNSYGGSGGSDGGNGVRGGNPGKSGYGGTGQGTTTRMFGEEGGTLFGGGGGGGGDDSGGAGGAGGGGSGGYAAPSYNSGSPGTANTGGGGGGGGQYRTTNIPGQGGSGIVIVRWNNAAS